MTDGLIVTVPLTGLLHGVQSGTSTLPDWPIAPRWMCAAVAGPVRPVKLSVNLSLLPVRVPVKLPLAFVFLTTCLGISCAAVSLVAHVMLPAADENVLNTSA